MGIFPGYYEHDRQLLSQKTKGNTAVEPKADRLASICHGLWEWVWTIIMFIYIIFRMRYDSHEYISITIIIITIIIIINFKQAFKDSQVLQTKVPMLILLLQQETKQN